MNLNGFSKILSWHLLLLLVNLKSSLFLWGVLEVQSQQMHVWPVSLHSGWEERKRWPTLKNTHTPPFRNSLCRLKQVSPKVAVFKNIHGVGTQLIQPLFLPCLARVLLVHREVWLSYRGSSSMDEDFGEPECKCHWDWQAVPCIFFMLTAT